MSNIEQERERLSQVKNLAWLRRDLQLTDMVTVYLSDATDSHRHGLYCALIPSEQVEQVLAKPSWDFLHGNGLPGTVAYYAHGKEQVDYLRFGNDSGIEPLIIDREFHGLRDRYKEISEEFRLFHNLYHDRRRDHYFIFDDDGNEELVAIVEPNRIQIRLREIRQFLAIREMFLSIQFDFREFSVHKLSDLDIERGGTDQHDAVSCWGCYYGDSSGMSRHHSFSRLLGKRLVAPLPKEKSGFWGFTDEPAAKYAEFVIGLDEDGGEIIFSCEPDRLANYFGANPDAPHFLTPVHFSKQVLEKYYQQPSKYTIEDGILRCGSLWSLYIDNHHDDRVCVWLGDLGESLSYREQQYWRSFNIPPGGGVSETFYRRQILGEFADSQRPEHLFQQKYDELTEACEANLGWQLLLPLDPADSHHLQSIRIPATDEQRDFDELVLGLTKVLIDSLNEKELNKLIPADQRNGLTGSIARLEAALAACGIDGGAVHVSFLRDLQSLRSSSSAHRKGSNYRKIAAVFGVDNQSLRVVFAGILAQSLGLLDFLHASVVGGQMTIVDATKLAATKPDGAT